MLTVVNTGDDDVELNVQFVDGGETQTIEVEAGTSVALGTDDVEGDDVLERPARGHRHRSPAACSPIYFQYGVGRGHQLGVPVLDGSLPEYADLAP